MGPAPTKNSFCHHSAEKTAAYADHLPHSCHTFALHRPQTSPTATNAFRRYVTRDTHKRIARDICQTASMPFRRRADSVTCETRTAVVTAPTPPGTGVMAETTGSTSSNRTSPHSFPESLL